MINYIIIDDEYIAHEIIKGYCDLLPNMTLKKNCYDAIEALEYLQSHQVDLIFLDLNMPKLKGFDFLRTLSSPPKVVVTTAYQEYALEGFELNVVDYLLKPFSFERFLKAINKLGNVDGSPPAGKIDEKSSDKPESSDKIFLRSNKRHFQIDVDSVLYLESIGNYAKVVTQDDTITVREKISDLLNRLPADEFIQVHKSFAVALKHIHSIEGNRIFIGEHLVPIGKVYRANIVRLLK